MKIIEKLDDLNSLIQSQSKSSGSSCILVCFDNKSNVKLQSLIVEHPVSFIRNLPQFSKDFNIPVSDVSIQLVGFISPSCGLREIDDIVEISPYIYFKKPDDVNVETSKEN